MLMQYPTVVDMALAASAPVLDFSPAIDVYSFFGNITNTFRDANASCPSVIERGFAQINTLSQKGDAGLATLTKAFNLCTPLKASQVEHLILWAVNGFTNLAMWYDIILMKRNHHLQ